MPRNGAGAYALPAGNPVVTGTAISSTVQNTTMTDIGTALTQSLAKDGQTTPSANLPMGSFRHTGVGNGVARTDYPSIGQVQDSSFMWCGTATGTANALLLVPTPIVPAIAAGQRFVFKSGASPNSAATTVSISTLPTIAVQVNGAACVGGEILADKWYEVIVDVSTTSCQLNKIGRATLTELGISAFAQTILDDVDAAAVRTTIGAAKSGANSDITSLSGLTTALSIAQGGTGNTTGSIPLGQLSAAAASSGYPQSGTGGETLRTLRGRVSGPGAVSAGGGFTITKGSTGNYTINFTTAFSSAPIVVATANTTAIIVAIGGVGTTTAAIICTTSASAGSDAGFEFIAIGPA